MTSVFDATSAARSPSPISDRELWNSACELRRRHWGGKVFLRGIIEFSNHCGQNCLYCGLRRENTALARYRMHRDAIFQCAQAVKRLGFGTVVLQAGEDPGFPAAHLSETISRIKTELGLAVTLSLGEWKTDVYAQWREAGADRYLLKLETADERLYAQMRPNKNINQRLAALEDLKNLGYETGSGLISGLPGQGRRELERGLEVISRLEPDMVSIGPFQPHPQTPLKDAPPGTVEENLNAMALARVISPQAHIPVTSALGLYGDEVRLAALAVGNVLMPSLTPDAVRAQYSIYPGKNADAQEPEARAAQFIKLLQNAGFEIGKGPGGAWRLSR